MWVRNGPVTDVEFSVQMGGLGVEITVPGRVSALRRATACMDSGLCDPRGWNSGFGLTESPGGREFSFSQPGGKCEQSEIQTARRGCGAKCVGPAGASVCTGFVKGPDLFLTGI